MFERILKGAGVGALTLGILITGPLGALLGTISGAWVSLGRVPGGS